MSVLDRALAVQARSAAGAAARAAKLRTALARAQVSNWWDNPVAATQPTVTTTYDATLGSFAVLGPSSSAYFNLYGGAPVSLYGGYGVTGGGASLYGQALVEFTTDAPKLQLRGNQGAWIVIVDGYPLSKSGTSTAAAGGEQQVVLDWSGVVKSRRYEVFMTGGASFVRVGTASPYRVWAPGAGGVVRACFEGDSYTAGTGATTTAGGYALGAAALLGWKDVWITAIGGTGWLNAGANTTLRQRIAYVTASAPDIVVIAAGTNDTSSSAAAITAEVQTYLLQLRAALPGTPIVVLGTWAKTTGPDSTITAVENAVSAGVAALGDPLIKFAPVSTATQPWIYGTGRVGATNGSGNSDIYIGSDAAHPNAAGHDYLARRTAAAVQQALSAMGLLN